MRIRTLAVTVSAPRDTVFNYLADVENLPKWAGGWCERLGLARGRWWALTSEGEQVIELEAGGPGVVDLRAGPGPERMTLTPLRIVELSVRRTLVTITVIEAADQTADAFERRYAAMHGAAGRLLARFGGGEIHASAPPGQLAELGLN